MIKGNMLQGNPIVSANSDEHLGVVEQVIYDQINSRVAAFEVKRGTSSGERLILPWSGIQSVKSDEVVATSSKMIVEASQIFEVKQILGRDYLKLGTRLVTTTGEDLGTLTDIYFDELTGVIQGYEVAADQIDDTAYGRWFVPATYLVDIAEDIAYLAPKTADLMRADVDGLRRAVHALSEHVATIGLSDEDALGDYLSLNATQHTLIQRWHLLVAVLYHALVEAREFRLTEPEFQALVASRTVDEMVGLRILEDVLSDEAILIAAEGQIVNAAIVNVAKTNNKAFALMKAVGLDVEQSIQIAKDGLSFESVNSIVR